MHGGRGIATHEQFVGMKRGEGIVVLVVGEGVVKTVVGRVVHKRRRFSGLDQYRVDTHIKQQKERMYIVSSSIVVYYHVNQVSSILLDLFHTCVLFLFCVVGASATQ